MRLVKARIQGYRSIIDSGYFEVEEGKTILVGPNEAGKTAILQALQKLNPPKDTPLFKPLRDYPRAKYDEDIENGNIDSSSFTVVEGYFSLEEKDKEDFSEEYHSIIYVHGRCLDNTIRNRIEGGPPELIFTDIEKDCMRMYQHFDEIIKSQDDNTVSLSQTVYDTITQNLQPTSIIKKPKAEELLSWLNSNFNNLEEDNKKENERYDRLKEVLRKPAERESVLSKCSNMMPTFILFSNYFRIRPVLHLEKLVERIENNTLDDAQYDYGNICLLKYLGFTPKELADAGNTSHFDLSKQKQYEEYKEQLDSRDYKLNAATIRLSKAIREIWNPAQDSRDVSNLRIKADGQYLKVVVEDEFGVDVELDQRSEGFQWMVSFFVVFFAEASEKHKNSILLLDEPGQSLHGLKQAEFRETLSKLSQLNQTIFTTHSPFLVGANELDKVRVVEMTNREIGTKVNISLTATDNGAMLPLQEALGYDLAQSLFFHKKNLVLEGLTDMWYLESISGLLKEEGRAGLDDKIALLPANCATKVVYYATILHAQNLKIAALLDSDTEGDTAAQQDTLVNALGNKRILRTKDAYQGRVTKVEIEDLFRDTLLNIAKEELGWDAIEIASKQESRPIVDIFADVAKDKFSKFQLAKAFTRWSRDHSLNDLKENERMQSEKLINKINRALS